MLIRFATQRFAPHNHSPEKERRLCYFAGPNAPTPQNPDDEIEDELEKENVEKLQLHNAQIEVDADAIRTRLEATIEQEPTLAEDVREKCKEVQTYLRDIFDLSEAEFRMPTGELTNLRKFATNPALPEEERKLFNSTMEYITQKMEGAAKFRTTLETLTDWENGELSPKDFLNSMKLAYEGLDEIKDETEQNEVLATVQEKITKIETFMTTYQDKWFSANPSDRLLWRRQLNRDLELQEMLNLMDNRLQDWKEINTQVKGELEKFLPKQPNISDDAAIRMHEAIETTLRDWEAEAIDPLSFAIEMEKIYRTASIGGTNERMEEINKFIAKWNTADQAARKVLTKKLNITIGISETKNFLNAKIKKWAEKKLELIRQWEASEISNAEFLQVMDTLYAFQGIKNAEEKRQMINGWISDYEKKAPTLNVSTRLEMKEKLKDVIKLRLTIHQMKRWVDVKVAHIPKTQEPTPSPSSVVSPSPATAAGTPVPPSTPNTASPDDNDDFAHPPRESGDSSNDTDGPPTLEKKESEKGFPVELISHRKGFFKDMGIEFYSINDIWGAMKRVGTAYSHAWHERATLKETTLANTMGKAIPGFTYMAGEVKLSLESAADTEKKKETNEFKEYLVDRDYTFEELFEGHGNESMAHCKNEPPKARAILEYAADRGWLYDIVDSKNIGNKTVLGHDIKNLCSDWGGDERKMNNYFVKLLGQNASGQESEISKGKKKEFYTDQAPLFITAIENSMDKLNFWEAVGIAQRSIERGLAGEISPWIAMTVMRYLNENGQVRKYINREAIDQFGLICLGHSARTLARLKNERRTIYPWVKDPSKMGKLEEASSGNDTFGKWTKVIQEHIIENAGETFEEPLEKRLKLYHMTAQLMAAQIVEVKPGVCISIFDEELVAYPRSIKNQGDSRVSDEDPDYYRNVSDVVLASKDVIARVLKPDGSGFFAQAEKGPNFIQTLITLLSDMKLKTKTKTVQNYVGLMNEKLSDWFYGVMKEGRSGPLATVTMPEQAKKSCVVALFDAGFLGRKEFDYAKELFLTEANNERLYTTMIQAMANDPTCVEFHQEAKDAVAELKARKTKKTP